MEKNVYMLNPKYNSLAIKIYFICILGGILWSFILFNILNNNYEKEVIMKIHFYGLIVIGIAFSYFLLFYIHKKIGLFVFFVNRIHKRSKVAFFFATSSIIITLSFFILYYLYNMEQLYSFTKEIVTHKDAMGKLMFSLNFTGVSIITFVYLLFLYIIIDFSILFVLDILYLFNKNYRIKYNNILNELIENNNKR